MERDKIGYEDAIESHLPGIKAPGLRIRHLYAKRHLGAPISPFLGSVGTPRALPGPLQGAFRVIICWLAADQVL